MSSSNLARQRIDRLSRELERHRRAHLDYTRRANREREEAMKYGRRASSSSSESMVRSHLRSAKSAEDKAVAHDRRAMQALAEVGKLETRLSAARIDLMKAEQRDQAQANLIRDRRITDGQRRVDELAQMVAHGTTKDVLLPAPQPEKLRVLLVAADGLGALKDEPGLRTAREQDRIRRAVRASTGRDYVTTDVVGATHPGALLDALTAFRPHVLHFSGHGNHSSIALEADSDHPSEPHVVKGEVFTRAVLSVDEPPLLVVLNSCSSLETADMMTRAGIPLAVGMAGPVDDADAIMYASRFYAAIAEGQSVQAAHDVARTELALMGVAGAEIPQLAAAEGVDAETLCLVELKNRN